MRGRFATRRGEFSADRHEFPSFALPRLIRALPRGERPRVLDLGVLCEETITQLAAVRARITIEDLGNRIRAVLPPSEVLSEVRATLSRHDFDLILGWDLWHYLTDEAVADLGALLAEATPTGQIYFTQWIGPMMPAVPSAYRLVAPDRLVRRSATAEWIPTRERTITQCARLIPTLRRQQTFLLRHGYVEHILVPVCAEPRLIAKVECEVSASQTGVPECAPVIVPTVPPLPIHCEDPRP